MDGQIGVASEHGQVDEQRKVKDVGVLLSCVCCLCLSCVCCLLVLCVVNGYRCRYREGSAQLVSARGELRQPPGDVLGLLQGSVNGVF